MELSALHRRCVKTGALLLAAASLMLTSTGCVPVGVQPPAPGSTPASLANAQPLGVNRIGEPCRLAGAAADPAIPASTTVFDVFCGRWEAASGHILVIDGDAEPTSLATAGWWRSRLERSSDCQPPVPTTVLDEIPAVVVPCALRPGGWRYRALAARIDGRVFLADALPASELAVLQGVTFLAGRAVPAQIPGTGEQDVSYSAGDILEYRRLLHAAQHYNFLGNHAEAEQRYRQALAEQQKLLPGDKGGFAFVLMHLALELSNQRRFSEADAMFNSAGDLLPSSSDVTDEARWTSYKALHFANQQRYATALDWARRATGLRLELARNARPELLRRFLGKVEPGQFAEGDRAGRAGELVIGGEAQTALGDVVQSRSLEASMLLRLGRPEEAKTALIEAERILLADPRVPRRWQPQLLLQQAELLERTGERDAAEQVLRACIEAQRAVLPTARTEGRAQVALGRVLVAKGLPDEALTAFEEGFAVLGRQGGGASMDDALPFFRTVLAQAARSPERLPELFEAAFRVAQVVRGTLTGQTMSLTAARLAASEGKDGQLLRALQDAKRRRDTLIQTVATLQADPQALLPQIAAAEQALLAANGEVARLERSVQAALPRYNQLIDQPVDLKQARDSLLKDEAVLQILVGEGGSIGLLIDAQGIDVYEIAMNEQEARTAVQRLRRSFDTTLGAPFDVDGAHALYRALLGPVEGRLRQTAHLTVVASGSLLSLPFGILVSETPAVVRNSDYSRVAWLIRRHALSVAPSLQSFVQLRSQVGGSQAARSFAGFGDFVPERNPDAILAALRLPPSCRDQVVAVANLSPLPETGAEVRTVASTLAAADGSIFVGTQFNEASVKDATLADYRVIYLATHGLLPQQLDCWAEPSLVVSHRPDERDDGLLVASEIAEVKLDADLVVLSACNTAGPGGQNGGESLSGLARAFFYAGARALIATHWQIPDEPTVRLMVELFRSVAEQQLTVDEALRHSQLRVANVPLTSHPLFWGAFSVVGDGNRTLDLASSTTVAAP